MMGYGYSWILMFFGGVIILGIIAVVIYALVHAVNVSGKSDSSASHGTEDESIRRALAVLAERYARGEITDEEYMKMKNEIKKM